MRSRGHHVDVEAAEQNKWGRLLWHSVKNQLLGSSLPKVGLPKREVIRWIGAQPAGGAAMADVATFPIVLQAEQKHMPSPVSLDFSHSVAFAKSRSCPLLRALARPFVIKRFLRVSAGRGQVQ